MPETDPQPAIERTVVLENEALRAFAGGFTAVPNRILKDPGLTLGARMAYAMLLTYAWQDDFCFPAQARLAIDLGVTDRSVRTFLTELRKKGLVTWRHRGFNRPNVYYLKRLPGPQQAFRSGAEKFSGPERKQASGQERKQASAYEYSQKNTQHVHVGDSPLEGTDGFRPIIDGFTPAALRREPRSEPDRLDYLASLAAEEFRDPKPLSRRTFRRIAARLGEAVFFEVLGSTREAARDGFIAGRTGAYFVGMAKKVAQERGVDLGLQTNPTTHHPRAAA